MEEFTPLRITVRSFTVTIGSATTNGNELVTLKQKNADFFEVTNIVLFNFNLSDFNLSHRPLCRYVLYYLAAQEFDKWNWRNWENNNHFEVIAW